MLIEYLDKFVMVYLDDIIIYLNSEEEYYKYVEWVLEQLSKVEIPIAIKKCEFLIRKTNFIWFIIKTDYKNLIGFLTIKKLNRR